MSDDDADARDEPDDGYGDRLAPPGSGGDADAGGSSDGEHDRATTAADTDSPGAPDPPDSAAEPGLRTRLRRRLGLGEQAWLVVETLVLVAPYPLFVWVLLYTDVPELPFLLATVVYSVLATVFGFGALGARFE